MINWPYLIGLVLAEVWFGWKGFIVVAVLMFGVLKEIFYYTERSDFPKDLHGGDNEL